LGDAVIGEDTIEIPVLYGKYDFPLTFKANVRYDGDIDKVIGVDFNEEITLGSIDETSKFMVLARSGLTRTYVIAARAAELDESNYIAPDVTFASVTPGVEMLPRADVAVSSQSSDYTLLMVGQAYPVTLTPRFTLPEGAYFEGFGNGETAMTFTDATTVVPVEVVAQSGAARTWNVRLSGVEPVSASDAGVAQEALDRTAVRPQSFVAAAPDMTIDRYVNSGSDRIELAVRATAGGTVTFPLDVTLHLEAAEGAWIAELARDTTMRFAGYDDVKRFRVVNPAAGLVREWTIVLAPWRDNAPVIETFAYEYTAPGGGAVLDPTATVIDASASQVWLAMTSLDETLGAAWKLTLSDVRIGVPEGASTSYATPVEWSGAEGWKARKEIRVTAEDGTERVWTLGLLDTSAPRSSACAITALRIESYRPLELTGFDPATPVTIDEAARRVTLHVVEDDASSYPLTVVPYIAVSDHATIPARPLGTEPLVFARYNAELPVEVRAQDGTTAVWTVALEVPQRADGNEIEQFEVSGLPAGFMPRVDIDPAASTVTVTLDVVAGAGALRSLDYRMTLSPAATADMAGSGTLEFATMRETKSVTVTSQSGQTRLWTVQLVCTPQLPNPDMAYWVDAPEGKWQNPYGWMTANNNFVVGTREGDGTTGGSDRAAVLTTSSTLGKIASGSLYLGEFKFDLGGALADPPKLTWFGIPFAATARVVALEADISYHSGGGGDMGSISIELVNHDQQDKTYEYHGVTTKPRTDNTATPVATGYRKIGPQAGDGVIRVEDGKWTRIRIPLTYGSDADPAYTHLSVAFASSWQGDIFTGVKGSELKVDNVRIIYE
ncbi:MAG: PCMD domain-containing protein, partial [Rikenellaceae bacterium]|nr:PCMD domain-containing protein [Rikenellaceae bacterium]